MEPVGEVATLGRVEVEVNEDVVEEVGVEVVASIKALEEGGEGVLLEK